jgi:hypothetical protein
VESLWINLRKSALAFRALSIKLNLLMRIVSVEVINLAFENRAIYPALPDLIKFLL